MNKSWRFSAELWLAYVAVFVAWKYFPSRTLFLVGGLLITACLAWRFIAAWRRRYFADRVDTCLHAYVIGDLLLESVAFEALRLFVAGAAGLATQFHNNFNFVGCTLTFTVLVGGYRWYALRRMARSGPVGSPTASDPSATSEQREAALVEDQEPALV